MSVSWKRRLRHMLLGWSSVGLAYTLGGLGVRDGSVLPELVPDRWLAFAPGAIWGYISFFLFVPFAYFCCDATRLRWLERSMQCCALVAGSIFLIWPSTLEYPAFAMSGLDAKLLSMLKSLDSTHNCLPSLHGALTMLCMRALWVGHRNWRSWVTLLWGCTILLSVIQLRRHLFVDLAAGVFLGYFSWQWACTKNPIHPNRWCTS
jgi:PAP2 superfamily